MTDADKKELCVLCGTPLAKRAAAEGGFCCSGCRRVFEVLGRLDDSQRASYLEAARTLGIIPGGGEKAKSEIGAEDPPPDPEASREQKFAVEGLVCPSCAWVAEQLIGNLKGVERARVDYFSGSASVTYDMRFLTEADLAARISPLGYRLEPMRDDGRAKMSRRSTLEFIVAAVLTMNLMTLSFVRYFEQLGWMAKTPDFLPWIEALLAAPVLYIGWIPTARRAAAALRRGQATMDLLLGMGVAAAAILSAAALVAGRSDIYFETAAGLVTISLLSRMIDARLRERAYLDLAPMLNMRVSKARKATSEGLEDYVDVASVGRGERIVFLPGEMVCVDGVVRGGEALVSEAVLTGEPAGKAKRPGDSVVAGSRVMDGRLELEVTRAYEETRLSQIAAGVAETLAKVGNRLRMADSIAAWFVPLIIAVSAGAWLFRAFAFGWGFALSPDGWFPSVAVLAVACPCAFSLAGVSAITAGTGNLLKKGILVKEPDQLEGLAKIRRIVFDKTGTVTEGSMKVEHLIWRKERRDGDLSLVLAAEVGSSHPIAQAIRAYLCENGITSSAGGSARVKDLAGEGRELDDAKTPFKVGSAALFSDRFDPREMTRRHTAVWFGRGDEAKGCFLITDVVKVDAAATVAALKRMNLEVEMVSGDRAEVARFVAEEIGVEKASGDMSIDGKVTLIKKYRDEGVPAAFVGDGTNDALAMSQAAVSVSMAIAADEALLAAGFVSLHGKIGNLEHLFRTGNRLARIIRTNYAWAFVFNAVFIPVAATGNLVPLAAMLLMLLSSSAVLLNSLRLRK